MKERIDIPAPEFSRVLPVEKIPAGGLEERLQANERERLALAERFGLLELPRLQAELNLEPARAGKMIAVKGRMQADVVQQCVVTLEPLPSFIEQEIDILFAAPELVEAAGSGLPTLEVDEEEIEAIVDGLIDLGELVAQHLGVALDPYPRKPGLAYIDAQYGEDGTENNPFAKLADLNKKPKG